MNDTALRKPTARRVVGMVAGIVIIALGIALFKQSHLGNDSISALNMRLAELLGISLGTQNLCTNILFFLLEFLVRAQVHRPWHLRQRHLHRVHRHGVL
ncbi:MAG: hypothetical protein ACLUW8_08045 [Subdoligranulum sp.]